jgi:signal transduction protein with GAF and PtsI domain
MKEHNGASEHQDIDFLHEIGKRISADPLHKVLAKIVQFVSSLAKCDSCLVYILEGRELVLRASKNPHTEVVGHLTLRMGQGITGWVAEHKKPVAISRKAFLDPRFESFSELPEDRYEAFLSVPILCRDKLVGVINVQHRAEHNHSQRDIQLISTIGFLVGAEIEMARLEEENWKLSRELQTSKLIEKARGILQRDLHVDEAHADQALQEQSRQTHKTMKQIAEALVLSDRVKHIPDPSGSS